MNKNVLIISSSARKGGNSESLAKAFADGANEGGNHVETLRLFDKKIEFCRGCLACQKLHKCIINDDANEISEKMKNADIIVFATPIYYYSISGQLKTMFDRANCLYSSNYLFRDIYLLAAAAEEGDETLSGTITAVQGWIDCYPKATLKKVIFAGGANDVGDIIGHSALTEAYDAGKNV